jgi:hypothetical protein
MEKGTGMVKLGSDTKQSQRNAKGKGNAKVFVRK